MKPRQLHVAEAPAVWGLAADLPDVNVWLALLIVEHPHHAAARRYWETNDAGCRRMFCRTTMLGVVRLLCERRLMGPAVKTLPQAWSIYRQLRESADVGFQSDRETADKTLAQWLDTPAAPIPGRLWTDAWLAALAESSGLRLVSFDSDIKRFPLSRSLLLGAA